MSKIKKYCALNAISGFFILVLFLPTKILPDDNSYQWQIGEELTYKVEWQFIRLGTLKVQVCDTMKMDSVTVYHLKLFIDSNPTLFFVNMHSIFESYVDKDLRTHLFRSVENIDNKKYNTNYRFDYHDSLIYVHMTDVKDTLKVIDKEMPLDKTILDVITMIFFARANVHSTYQDTLTAIFEAKKGDVTIHFKGIHEKKIKIGALDAKMDTYYLDGKLPMKGIAGVTGPFKGWFAVDKQRPPLKANLEVWIGSVTVELEKWENWNPSLSVKSD